VTLASALRAYAGLGARIVATRLGSTLPFKITLALTDRCDCRCAACFIWKKPKGREVTPEEVHDLLAGVPTLRWLNLTGGEPFLRDDVAEVVDAARRALPQLAVLDLPSTGQRTDSIVDQVERIVRLGVPRFYVTLSLEGPPALHDRLRGRPGAFDRMVDTLAALRRVRGVKVYLGMTLSSANADVVEEALEAVGRRLPASAGPVGWEDLHLNVFTHSDHYYANAGSALEVPVRPPDAIRKALRAREASWEPTDRIESVYLRLIEEHLRTGRSPLPCRSLSASVYVAANGDVYPCTVWDRRLGNALETPLAELLSRAEADAARRVIARDACPGCWSPCEANPTIVAHAPASLFRRPRTRSRTP